MRQRIVDKPYVLVAEYDRSAAAQRAWDTRRANPKPYPEVARHKARARALDRINRGLAVSNFERKAAEVFRSLGANLATSVQVRDRGGRFAAVFDLCIPERRIFIECHGTYWHGGRWLWDTPAPAQAKNLAREEAKVVMATAMGFQVRILWEHDFKRDPRGSCLAVMAPRD